MLKLRATLLDDRGREVDLIRPMQLARANIDLAAAPRLAKFLTFVIKAESQRFNWRRTPLLIIGGGLLSATVIIALGNVRGVSPFVWMGLIALLAVAMLFAKRSLTRRTTRSSLAATAVSMGVCGSCAYALEHLSPESDGCVVCPECGAAWKHFRITRPHYGPPKDVLDRAPWSQRLIMLVPTKQALLGTDARSVYFHMLDKRLRLLPQARRAQLGPQRIAEIRRAVCRVGLGWRWLLSMPPFAAAAMFIVAAITRLVEADLSKGDDLVIVVIFTFFASCLFLVGIAIVRGHNFASPGKRGAVAAKLGLCSACGRDLAAATPDPDGCVVCHGCGAAWKAAAPTRIATPAERVSAPPAPSSEPLPPPQTGPETITAAAYDRP